jgi:endonuclease/exonuclease/phosphatase family metal-dependent hydrolase
MENKLTIVTYNIHHGSKPEAITKNLLYLAANGADVFCLQELRKEDGKNFLLDDFLKKLGPNWKAEYIVKPGSNDLGLCTIWDGQKLQALTFEPLLLPKLKKLYFYELAWEKIRKEYPRPVQRAVLIGDFNLNGQRLRITNVHLDWQGGSKQRMLQLSHFYSHVKSKEKVEREIMCGDFNTIGFYRFHKRGLTKIKKIVGDEFTNKPPKKPTTTYLETLDHILVKNLTVLKTEVLKLKGSDHFPLLAEIQI